MNRVKKPRRFLAIVLSLAVAGLALLGVVLVTTGASNGPSAEDMAGISGTIGEWNALTSVSVPEATAREPQLPESDAEQIDSAYAAALDKTGTPEFADSSTGQFDPGLLFQRCQARGEPLLSMERKVLAVDFTGNLDNGDVLVQAKIWVGETSLGYASTDSKELIVKRVDSTPVRRYQMRKVDGMWRIVTEATVFESEDASPEFGPNTPHWVDDHPSIGEKDGLMLQSTPKAD